MLFLPKRKIVSMMRELFPSMRKSARRQLANHLDKSKANKAIEATWELAVLWALKHTLPTSTYFSASHTTVNPDAEIDIGLHKRIVIDVKTLSGDTFEFRQLLDDTSRAIFSLANRIKPGSGEYISIRYFEWRNAGNSVKPRIPSVTVSAARNQQFQRLLSNFLLDESTKEALINIPGVIHANFRKTNLKSIIPKYSCQISNYSQSIENNVSTKLIDDAIRQLVPFQGTHYVGLIVCDGGNEIFSDPSRFCASYGSVSGADIMNYVIETSHVDFIVCLGRKDEPDASGIVFSTQNKLKTLAFTMFHHPQLPARVAETIRAELRRALATLPIPLLHPYQSKNLQAQEAAIGSASPYYLNGSVSHWQGEPMKVRISSRALLAFMTGEMSIGQFERDYLALLRSFDLREKLITTITLEPSGDNRDDDYVVIDLGDDITSKTFAEIEKTI